MIGESASNPAPLKRSTFQPLRAKCSATCDYVQTVGRPILLIGCFFTFIISCAVIILGLANLMCVEAVVWIDVPAGRSAAIAVTVIGVISAIVSALGLGGAVTRSRIVLGIFIVIVMCACLAEVAIAIAVGVNKERLPDALDIAWSDTEMYRKCAIQEDLTCCGYKTVTDRPCTTEPCPINPWTNATTTRPCEGILYDKTVGTLRAIEAGLVVLVIVEVLAVIIGGALGRRVVRKRQNHMSSIELVDNDDENMTDIPIEDPVIMDRPAGQRITSSKK